MIQMRTSLMTALFVAAIVLIAQQGVAQTTKIEEKKFDELSLRRAMSKLQEVPWQSAITTIERIDGYYTYKAKGALVSELGAKVVEPLAIKLVEGMVQFRPCSSRQMIAVVGAELHRADRTCGNGGGTWLRKIDDALVPATGPLHVAEALVGKKIMLSSFPPEYQATLSDAKNGAFVAYSAKNENGDLTLSLFNMHKL